jgi:hypothetical protein
VDDLPVHVYEQIVPDSHSLHHVNSWWYNNGHYSIKHTYHIFLFKNCFVVPQNSLDEAVSRFYICLFIISEIQLPLLRKSDAIQVNIDKIFCNMKLSGDNVGVHTIQFQEPLTPETSYFYVEVKKASKYD